MNIAFFLYRTPPVTAFVQVTVQYWATADFLLLIRNNVEWFLLKMFVYVLYILLVEPIPTRFCRLTFTKQKLVQRKRLQQGLLVLVSVLALDRLLSIIMSPLMVSK